MDQSLQSKKKRKRSKKRVSQAADISFQNASTSIRTPSVSAASTSSAPILPQSLKQPTPDDRARSVVLPAANAIIQQQQKKRKRSRLSTATSPDSLLDETSSTSLLNVNGDASTVSQDYEGRKGRKRRRKSKLNGDIKTHEVVGELEDKVEDSTSAQSPPSRLPEESAVIHQAKMKSPKTVNSTHLPAQQHAQHQAFADKRKSKSDVDDSNSRSASSLSDSTSDMVFLTRSQIDEMIQEAVKKALQDFTASRNTQASGSASGSQIHHAGSSVPEQASTSFHGAYLQTQGEGSGAMVPSVKVNDSKDATFRADSEALHQNVTSDAEGPEGTKKRKQKQRNGKGKEADTDPIPSNVHSINSDTVQPPLQITPGQPSDFFMDLSSTSSEKANIPSASESAASARHVASSSMAGPPNSQVIFDTINSARAEDNDGAEGSNSSAKPPSNISSSAALEARNANQTRIRLFDEESDTNLQTFNMPEYDGDDTNHTDDEDAGLYLPKPQSDNDGSKRHPSSRSSRQQAPLEVPTKKPRRATKNDTKLEPEKKKSRRSLHTTPSRIREGLRSQSSKSSIAADVKSDSIPSGTQQSDDVETDPIVEDSASQAPPPAESMLLDEVHASVPSAAIRAPERKKSKPVVEIPLRKGASPAISPRKSPRKLSCPPLEDQLDTNTSETPATSVNSLQISVDDPTSSTLVKSPSHMTNVSLRPPLFPKKPVVNKTHALRDAMPTNEMPGAGSRDAGDSSRELLPVIQDLRGLDASEEPAQPDQDNVVEEAVGVMTEESSRVAGFLDRLADSEESSTSDSEEEERTNGASSEEDRNRSKNQLLRNSRGDTYRRRRLSSSPEMESESEEAEDNDEDNIQKPNNSTISTSIRPAKPASPMHPQTTTLPENPPHASTSAVLEAFPAAGPLGEGLASDSVVQDMIQNPDRSADSQGVLHSRPSGLSIQDRSDEEVKAPADVTELASDKSSSGASHSTLASTIPDFNLIPSDTVGADKAGHMTNPEALGLSVSSLPQESFKLLVASQNSHSSENNTSIGGTLALGPSVVDTTPSSLESAIDTAGDHRAASIGAPVAAKMTDSQTSAALPTYTSNIQMSQPVFAALRMQSSPPAIEESQEDELAESPYKEVSRQRLTDINGPSPSPISTGFDTASQIEELFQSSFDERIARPENVSGQVEPDTMLNSSSPSSESIESDDDVQRRLLGDARSSKTQPNLNDVHQDSAIGDPNDTSVYVSLEEIADPISRLPTVPPSQMLVNPMDMLSRPPRRNSHANGSPASALLPPSTQLQTSNAGIIRSPPATLPLPSILPRNKSISAVQQRFQGKAAERRNSNSLQRPAQSSTQPVQLRRSAESEEDSDDEDSEDDIPSSSVQLTGIGTGHRASLAYLLKKHA